VKRKTNLMNYAYFPAAAINILGNMIFLPKYGYMAAAWVSVATYFAFSFILYFAGRKLIEVQYEVRMLVTLFLAAIFIYKTSTLIVFDNILIEITKGTLFIILFIGVLFVAGFFTKGEIEILRNRILRLRGHQKGKLGL